MPPKKQEEVSAPFVAVNVLPVFGSDRAREAIKKAVSIKKNIDVPKIIQTLKEKGIDQYLSQEKLTEEGEKFVCQQLAVVCQEVSALAKKPVDPKKDAKKDNKKQAKKQQPVDQPEKPIEYDFPKNCNQFYILTDFPKNGNQLQLALKNGLTVDVVVNIKEKVKEGSVVPDYSLLNREKSIDELLEGMKNEQVREKKEQDVGKAEGSDILKRFREIRMTSGDTDPIGDAIVVDVPFEMDMQTPYNDAENFLKNLFQILCNLTINKTKYEQWKSTQKISPMIQPLKQTIQKQVQIQKKQQKKGAKGAQQPQTEIVTETIQTKYEDVPQNIKSDLTNYVRFDKQRQSISSDNIYKDIAQNMILSVCSAEEEKCKKAVDYRSLGDKSRDAFMNLPLNRVGVNSLAKCLRNIRHPSQSGLSTSYNFKAHSHRNDITLLDLTKNPQTKTPQKTLQLEYYLKNLTCHLQKEEPSVIWDFSNRKYLQNLPTQTLNSIINNQLEQQPKTFMLDLQKQDIRLLVLAKVNPPGRILKKCQTFGWKVLPNFEFWCNDFQGKEEADKEKDQRVFYDYGWKNNGNLKIKSQIIMPTDNMIICESAMSIGDQQMEVVTLRKETSCYGIKGMLEGCIFWKNMPGLKVTIFNKEVKGVETVTKNTTSEEGQQQAQTHQLETTKITPQNILQTSSYTLLHSPYSPGITIHYHRHKTQKTRQITSSGQIIKHMKDNTTTIYYKNGDISTLKYGAWNHTKNDYCGQNKLNVQWVVQGEKKIGVRDDGVCFVDYAQGVRDVVFGDGTIVKLCKGVVQIASPEGLLVRIREGRSNDFNTVGHGSAFAFLGFKNLSQRTYNGYIFQTHTPHFTLHSYTEQIDFNNSLQKTPTTILTFPDNSLLKQTHHTTTKITFQDKTTNTSQQNLNERWLQLFTPEQYHKEGVYDVDIDAGKVSTKDGEGNLFQMRIGQKSRVQIAVSLNVGQGEKEEKDIKGWSVPEGSYFLPKPHNKVQPRIFVLYANGSGAQILSDCQLQPLQTYTHTIQNKTHQYTLPKTPPTHNLSPTFTSPLKPSSFILPNLLRKPQHIINKTSYKNSDIFFRRIQEIDWDRSFQNVQKETTVLKEGRARREEEMGRLRKKK